MEMWDRTLVIRIAEVPNSRLSDFLNFRTSKECRPESPLYTIKPAGDQMHILYPTIHFQLCSILFNLLTLLTNLNPTFAK